MDKERMVFNNHTKQREMITLETPTVSTNGRDQDTIGLSVLYQRLTSLCL